MRIDKATFTVFDVETTGLYPYSGDKICEIAAIRINYKKNSKTKFHSLIDPGIPLSRGAFLVNGITENMLENQPKIHEMLPHFISFVKGTVLVAYNAGFDLGFLESALGKDKDILADYNVIDALTLARRLFPEIGRYSLANVASSLGVSAGGSHRAMADSIMTMKVFQKEMGILIEQGIENVEDIAKIQKMKAISIEKVKDYRLSLIEAAIREQKKLNITYRSSWTNHTTKRVITPKKIQKGYDRLYVIAHCHLKNDERNFRLDGILDAKAQV